MILTSGYVGGGVYRAPPTSKPVGSAFPPAAALADGRTLPADTLGNAEAIAARQPRKQLQTSSFSTPPPSKKEPLSD